MKRYINKLIIIVLGFSIYLLSCQKDYNGFGGTDKISGKITMLDTLSIDTIPVQNAQVFIGFGFKPNTVTYSYKVTTDKYGKFEISFLNKRSENKDNDYQIFAQYSFLRYGSQYTYSINSNVRNPVQNIILILQPDSKTDRVSGTVIMHDSLTYGNISVNSADVFMGYKFIPNSTQYSYKLVTDLNGEFLSPLLPVSDSSNYHFFVSKKISIGGKTITLNRIRTFQEFRNDENKVLILPSDSLGFVTITILDKNGATPQPNVPWGIYSDSYSFMNPKPFDGSIYSSTTNFNGMGYVSGLTMNGKYYIKGFKTIGKDTLWLKDSISIPSTSYPVYKLKFK